MASIASCRAFLPLVLVLLIAVAIPAVAAGARPPTTTAAHPASLAKRLDSELSQQCWEAYLGRGCCRAIRVIEQHCWATDAILSIIGFTPEEGDMLKGYCDAGDDDGSDNNASNGRHGRVIGGLQPAPPPTPYHALNDIGTGGSNYYFQI